MESYLLRGVLIGLLFGLPVGAVGTMTVQRTWSFGVRAGLLTGLGSSVADCLYACIGAFGLTLLSDFLLRYQIPISILGGGLVLVMGIRLLVKRNEDTMTEAPAVGGVQMFFSSFAVGITNPAAILTFLFAFSYFEVADCSGLAQGCPLVCGVFIGTYIWWGLLSFATRAIKKKTGSRGFPYMNQIFGGVLVAFGAVVYLRLLTQA